MLNPKLWVAKFLSHWKVLTFYFEMDTIKVNLARKHNDTLSGKTSNITTLLWIDLNFATSIVYPLDRLLNNLCKNLM